MIINETVENENASAKKSKTSPSPIASLNAIFILSLEYRYITDSKTLTNIKFITTDIEKRDPKVLV